jgi:hypothetical protein
MIEFCQEKYPIETMMARRDFAHVTKTRVVEPPYWFRDTATGLEYHGIYGAIGWPQRLSERGDERSGYGVVVGVRKIKGQDPGDARFDVLEEIQELSGSEGLLIKSCVEMRSRWGYGVHESILPVFYGDHRPFELVVADFNTRIAETMNNDRHAFIVTPPDDYDNAKAFDVFMGRLASVLAEKSKRLYLGNHDVIKNRIQAFKRDDPAIMALGGLVHVLLLRQSWMEQSTESVWQMEDV